MDSVGAKERSHRLTVGSDDAGRFWWLPNLTDYRVTSPPSEEYNCFAWAYGDTSLWFDPRVDLGYHWPLDSKLGLTIEAVLELFRTIGYEECTDGSLESGFEKVAIYIVDDGPAHVARQLHNGRWSSKLGRLEDIEHATTEELNCPDYGAATAFMKRPST